MSRKGLYGLWQKLNFFWLSGNLVISMQQYTRLAEEMDLTGIPLKEKLEAVTLHHMMNEEREKLERTRARERMNTNRYQNNVCTWNLKEWKLSLR